MPAREDVVWLGYQACGWLTPRMTKALPPDSTIFVPLTRSPTAACAGCTATSIEIRSASSESTAASAIRSRFLMGHLSQGH